MDQDSRLMVRFASAADVNAASAGAASALLIEDGEAGGVTPPLGTAVARFSVPAATHAIGCACCLPRGPAAVALGRLFLARARGDAALFDTVVAVTHSAAGAAAVRAALDGDVVTRARYRLAPD
jgi:hypothetical protein